jgi:hypothetical protein
MRYGSSWGSRRQLNAAAIGLAISFGCEAGNVVLNGPARQSSLAEFTVAGVPPVDNPFDPDTIQVVGTLRAPSGSQQRVPAFWFREHARRLAGGNEEVSPTQPPEWRLRFRPVEVGPHTLVVTLETNGTLAGAPIELEFSVTENPNPPVRRGVVRIAANQRQFETPDGRGLRLNGHCVCWHQQRGTFDYDDWFAAMAAAGENYARIWMAPWAFGIEAELGSGVNYRLDRAWQLDHVFRLAEQHGIYLMLCFDYHGMFETKPDYWGGNDNWKVNPYNAANGGPCASQNEFFTKPEARAMYQKRVRYLIARYGHSPNLAGLAVFQ